MKRFITITLLVAGASVPAFGIPYHGTINYTVTGVTINNPGSLPLPPITASVGDTFSGSYQYTSSTLDGHFSWDGGGDGLLSGELFLPAPFNPNGELVSGLFPFDIHFSMTVSGGIVTDFRWPLDFGFLDGDVSETSITLLDHPHDNYQIILSGAMTFGAPTVPDSGATIWLLVGSIAGLCLLHHFSRTAQVGQRQMGSA